MGVGSSSQGFDQPVQVVGSSLYAWGLIRSRPGPATEHHAAAEALPADGLRVAAGQAKETMPLRCSAERSLSMIAPAAGQPPAGQVGDLQHAAGRSPPCRTGAAVPGWHSGR